MTGRCVLRNRRQGSRHAPGSPGTVDNGALTATLRVPTVQLREPLVEAKLAAPYLRAAVLQRDALVRELLRTNAGLVTMVAPPGYGKSTSLALWRARERRPVAWVTCDAADADPIRFLSYVGLAIERALDLATPIFDGVPLNAESALSFAVPRLTSALHAARLALVLMLDDVHHVAGHAIGRRAVDDRRLPAGRGDDRGRGPNGRRAARRAPPRERQAGRDRCRRPGVRRAGGQGCWRPSTDASCARTRRASSTPGPRAGRPPCTSPPAGPSAPPGRETPAAVGVSGRDTDIGDYLDAELLDHLDAPRARVPAPHGDPRSHVGRPVRRRRRGQGIGPNPPRPGLDQPAGGAAGYAGRLVPLPHAAARAPPREARARPRRRRGRAPPRGRVVRRQRHARAGRRPPVRRRRSGRGRGPGVRRRAEAVPRGARGDVRPLARHARRRRPAAAAVPRRAGGVDAHDPRAPRGRGAAWPTCPSPRNTTGIARRAPTSTRKPGPRCWPSWPATGWTPRPTTRGPPSRRAPRSARGDRSRWRCWARS